jgi:hypothetical protein
MLTYKTTIKKFAEMGEKTGWTYIEISAEQAAVLNPGVKTSFRVKGKLDALNIRQIAIIPMGEGDFIMPVNATMRKALKKREGSHIDVILSLDKSPFIFSEDFILCLQDEPEAYTFFNTLAGSHQRYFSKWIDSAKTIETKSKRIVMAISALKMKQGYGEMLRANKKTNS